MNSLGIFKQKPLLYMLHKESPNAQHEVLRHLENVNMLGKKEQQTKLVVCERGFQNGLIQTGKWLSTKL